MKVYLVQHGESKSEIEDPDRPLTEKGKETVASVARYLASLGMEVAEILHSGRLRARQTAELFAQHLSPARGVKEEKWLGPLDDPQKARRLIQQVEGPLMIIGHLPHLSRMVSMLILGTPQNEIIRFKMGGAVCLSESNNRWLVDWMLVPECI